MSVELTQRAYFQVNPFLYSILSARFRKAYRSTLCYCLYAKAETHREQCSIHSVNSQACSSLRYRPSSVAELGFMTSRQNSLITQSNGHERLSLKHSISNGHSLPAMPLNLVWGKSKKYLVPVSNVNGVRDALVIYCPKKTRKDECRKKKSRPKTKAKETEETSSISGSSLQERDIDPEQVSDFINSSKSRSATPRLVVHPPSDSGSGNSNSKSIEGWIFFVLFEINLPLFSTQELSNFLFVGLLLFRNYDHW